LNGNTEWDIYHFVGINQEARKITNRLNRAELTVCVEVLQCDSEATNTREGEAAFVHVTEAEFTPGQDLHGLIFLIAAVFRVIQAARAIRIDTGTQRPEVAIAQAVGTELAGERLRFSRIGFLVIGMGDDVFRVRQEGQDVHIVVVDFGRRRGAEQRLGRAGDARELRLAFTRGRQGPGRTITLRRTDGRTLVVEPAPASGLAVRNRYKFSG